MGNLGTCLIGSSLFLISGIGVVISLSQYNESTSATVGVDVIVGVGVTSTSVSTFFLNLPQYHLNDLSKKYLVRH
jgi:hypothetical protein